MGRALILPTQVLFKQYEEDIRYLTTRGIDIKELFELSLEARNRSDNNRLKALGISYTFLDALAEEIYTLLDTLAVDIDDFVEQEVPVGKMFRLAGRLHHHLGDILQRGGWCVEDLDIDMVCGRWIAQDMVIVFRAR